MIAVDTNILVYAHRKDSEWFEIAKEVVRGIAEDTGAWAIPWPCVHEFLSIVTHPKIFNDPTPPSIAFTQIETWLESPSLQTISELPGYWIHLKRILESSKMVGPMIHDARIAAICIQNGVEVLYTADKDFSRIGALKIVNPLVKNG